MKKTLALVGILILLLCGQPDVQAWQAQGTEKLAPPVGDALAALGPGEHLTIIATLREQARLDMPPSLVRAERIRRVVQALQTHAEASQRPLKSLLTARLAEGQVSQVTYFWVFNGLAVTATPDVIRELAARPEVLRITPNATIQAPTPSSGLAQFSLSEYEPNLGVIRAPDLWAFGLRGQGVVVANMDTGVSLNHPDLVAQWRGGTNSWYDPYGEHPTMPTDLNGHGTWTMGVIVGRNAGGTAIGVAPEAQWIAVNIFNDRNRATSVAIHQGFQWLLDPDGDPATPDAPHVVNNSWDLTAPGCDLVFQADLQALRAAGILPVFAAGNFGPSASTSVSPANYPEALAVGAVDNSGRIYAESSRGPSACDESIFPDLVAPGVNIRTTDRYGLYTTATGTSLAAPHAAGALALLLSARPELTVEEQEAALLNLAVDQGPAGPDNEFGHGRLDVLAAYQSLVMHQRVFLPLVLKAATVASPP